MTPPGARQQLLRRSSYRIPKTWGEVGRRPTQFRRRGDLEPAKEAKGSLVAFAPPLSATNHVIKRSTPGGGRCNGSGIEDYFLPPGVRYSREQVVGGARRSMSASCLVGQRSWWGASLAPRISTPPPGHVLSCLFGLIVGSDGVEGEPAAVGRCGRGQSGRPSLGWRASAGRPFFGLRRGTNDPPAIWDGGELCCC